MNNNYNLTRGTQKRRVLQRFFLGICTLFLTIQLQAQTFCNSCNGNGSACNYPSVASNPNLTAGCNGMDILFIIDESGSTDPFKGQIRDAVMTFLRSLNCVGVNMAVIEFSGTARYLKQAYTLVDGAFIEGMRRYFNDDTSNPWTNRVFDPDDEDDDGNDDNCTNSDPFCGTNWQAAFLAADALATPDLVLFFTDGIPTVYTQGSNPDFSELNDVDICGNGQTTQRPEIVNAMKLANKIKGEGAHIFALGVGAFDPTDTSPNGPLAQLKRVSGNTAHNPNSAASTIRNSDYAAESFDQLAECLATFSDALCEFDAEVTSEDGCPGDNNGALQITVPQNLLPVTYSYNGPGANDGNGTSNSSPILISNLPAGNYFIEVEVSYGSNCIRKEAFFETIVSQTCTGTPTINCPARITYDCNPTDNNGDDLPDAIPVPDDEIAAGKVTGNNPNCDVTISHDGDSQIMQDPTDDCLFYIIRTYRVNNKCGNGTNTCTQRFEWTVDDEKPTIVSCPSGGDLGCNPSADEYAPGTATWDDNCGIADSGVEAGTPSSTDGCSYSVTHVYYAVDNCGKREECEQTFTWTKDDEKPTIVSCPSGGDLGCNPSADEYAPGTATWDDNCGIADSGVEAGTPSSTDGCSYSVTHVYYAVDNCGKREECEQTFTWTKDVLAPIASDCDTGGDLGCNPAASTYAADDFPDWSDACDFSSGVIAGTPTSDGCNWTVTHKYWATDQCNNTDTCYQTFTWTIDVDKPTIVSCPPGDDLGCNPDPSEYAPGTAVWNDNCGIADKGVIIGIPTSDDDCSYSVTHVHYVVDNCGHREECSQTFTWTQDTEGPIMTDPSTRIEECGPGDDDAFQAWLDNHGGATATDNCGEVHWSHKILEYEPGCCSTGEWKVRFIAKDDCGNKSTKVAKFKIVDTTAPEISCPTDVTDIPCGAPLPDPDVDTVHTSDNCDCTDEDDGVVVEWEGDESNNASGCEGDPIIITRTYRATDACGNSAVCHQRFIYREDLVAPEITVEAADKTVECDGQGNEKAFEAWLTRHGGAKAEDDCNELDWTYDVVGTDEGCGGTLIYTVTFTATDACENSSETTANFIIVDTTPPTIELAAANETVECDGAGNVAAFEAWLAQQGGAVAADICSGVSWTHTIDEEVDNCGLTKSYKVTFTATDDCTNSSATTAYFIIEDTTPPVITNEAADKSVECDGEGNMEQFQEWLSLHGGATATDDCGNVSWSMVIEDKSESCGATGYMTVTFVATDECDNSSQTTATFTIVDTAPPIITATASNKTVECDGEGNEAALQSWLDMHGGASAEDACSDVTWTYQMSSEPGCGLTQVITVIFTATDDCTNNSQTSATFTIEDTTDPVLDAPATADIACDDPLPTLEDAIAEDACGDVNVVGSIDPYEVDVCNGYQVTYRWTATDDCGNDTDVTSTFNVLPDTDAPVITPIHPALMDTPNGGTLPAIECNNADPDWNPFTFTEAAVMAEDDCSGVTVTMTDELVEEGCGTTAGFVSKWICTWTATDACGNASSYSIYMLIVDTTPPVFDQDPADVTVACGEMPAMPEITAQDACSDVQISYSISAQPGECAGEKILLRTWIAEDACGNTSSISQRIYQVDNEAPTIILRDELADYQNGQDVYVDCASFNDYIFLENKARATDDCDTDPSISYDFKIFPPVNNCEAKGYTRKLEVAWTATDGCGNSSTFELTIYGVDETPPVFDEAPTVICATSDAIPAATGVTATDACSDVTLSVSDDGGADCGDGSVIIRTWVAEDDCGNVAEFVQQIVLDDSTAPTISVNHSAFEGANSGDEVSIEADCANGDEFGLPDLSALVEVNDGCATMNSTPSVVLGLLEEGSCEAGFLYLVRMTVTATDACGNEASADYTLRVQDTSGPVFSEAASELTLDCSEAFPTPIVLDACGGLVELSVTEDGNFDVCNAADDPLIRTWVATDQCGNSTTFVQTIYVVDTTPPVFIGIPDDECMEDGVIPEVPLVTAVDGCNETPAEVFYEQTVEDGDCGQVIVRTWMTWDACDNKDTVVQRIIEEDTTPPTIAFSHPDLDQLESGATIESSCVNFQEDHEPEYDASAVSVADNCSDDIDVAFSYELVASGDCQTDGYVERYRFTWVATDPCGNSASLELYVNAVDVTPPAIFERPASVINLYCDQAIPAPMELLAVDACSGVTVDFMEETTYPSPGMTAIGRTWIATDGCGNSETVTQWIKIQDYQLECNFLNYENEVSCGSDDNTITVAVTGGTAPYTYNWDLVDCDGIMVEGMDSQTLTFIAGFTPLNFVVEVTDANGCSTTCTLTVPCKKDKGNRPSQGVGVGIGNGNANGNGNGNGHGRPGGNLVIYPNPSTGTYYLEFEEYFDQPAKVIVRNLVGQHVKTTKLDEIPTEAIELDLQELPDGMYTVMIEVDGVITAIHKVIKEQ